MTKLVKEEESVALKKKVITDIKMIRIEAKAWAIKYLIEVSVE